MAGLHHGDTEARGDYRVTVTELPVLYELAHETRHISQRDDRSACSTTPKRV